MWTVIERTSDKTQFVLILKALPFVTKKFIAVMNS